MEVDYTSRHFNNRTERTLSYKIFRQITARYYTPQVDLFASTINNQLLRYVSRYPDPGSLATDAFLLDCSQWTVSIHPPIVLIPRMLLQMRQNKATGLMIAPAWQGQHLCPDLLEMLVDYPALFPVSPSTIFLPFTQDEVHPMWRTLQFFGLADFTVHLQATGLPEEV